MFSANQWKMILSTSKVREESIRKSCLPDCKAVSTQQS